MLRGLLNGNRKKDAVNVEKAKLKAQDLYNAGQGKYYGTDEVVFVR
jgi:hypothetical protein